eukprot:2244861-Pleurochrysis_carterae.AAC.1
MFSFSAVRVRGGVLIQGGTRGVWATEAPGWSSDLTIPFPLPQVSERDTDRLTQDAKKVTIEEHFPSSPDSPL